jgi:protein YIPF5/7
MFSHSADAESSTGPMQRSNSFGRMQPHHPGGGFGNDGFYSSGGPQSSPMASSSFSPMASFSSQPAVSGPYSRSRPYQPVASYEEDYINDGPLLQELGVDFSHIYLKVQSVLHPLAATSTPSPEIMQDSDMAGPIVFCVVLGFLLLLAGKVHFGYIYGFGLFGVLSMWTILNLMAEARSGGIDFSRTFSILGYALLPVVGLAGLNVLFNMKGLLGELNWGTMEQRPPASKRPVIVIVVFTPSFLCYFLSLQEPSWV